ncbi:MAG TPA: asparagine synthase-related protein [Spirochaetota bacterium]|nr:asparagine synthase-related protein [Spirochaetota bacterium]HPL18812.1 asparagine synthase-related protein [Spirochaetota bacterium]
MPGLTGIVGVSNSASKTAREMASSLGLGLPEEKISVAGSQHAAMAAEAFPVKNPRQNVFISPDGSIIGINGEIYGLSADDNCPAETFSLNDRAHPACLTYELYRRNGLSVIPRLRGAFSIALWDYPSKTLHLASDRYGMRPMYYSYQNDFVVFSSEVRPLLRVLPAHQQPDEQGIADFLFLGMPTGARTFFKKIHLMPAATILSMHNSRVTSTRYWELNFHSSKTPCDSIEHAAELFAEAFSEAVNDCTSDIDRIELPLSGGLDSRCLAVAAPPRKNVVTYTIGSEGSVDLVLGPKISRILGLPNSAWTITAADFLDWIPKTIFLTDGMYSPLDSPIIYIAERLTAGASMVLDGTNSFDGSYMFPQVLLDSFLHLQKDPLKYFLKICPAPVVGSDGSFPPVPFTGEYIKMAEGFLRATFNEVLSTIPADHKATFFDTLDYLEQSNRVPRYNMMGTVILRAFCEVRHPLFDHRVVDAVTTFTPLLRAKEKFVIGRYLRNVNLPLARVIYERTGLPADSGMTRQVIRYAETVFKRVLGRLSPSLKPGPKAAIDFMSFILKDAKLQAYLRDMLLGDNRGFSGYFSTAGLERLWAELVKGRKYHLPLVMRIITLKLWAHYFLHDGAWPDFKC